MSETARRIRILLYLRESGSMTMEELAKLYSSQNMIKIRLERLQKMGMICHDQDGNYQVKNNIAVMIAYLFHVIRKLLGF